MAKMDAVEKVWQLPLEVTEAGDINKVLQTADTYLDKNIKVSVHTPDAEFEIKNNASVTATVSSKDTTYTSETETAYPIVIAADATAGAVQVGVKTAGFAAASDVIDVESVSAEQNTKTIYVKEGHLAGESETDITSTSVKMTKGSTGNFVINAAATGSVKVDVAGWLPENASADANSNVSYSIQEASLNNTGSADSVELTTPVLTSGGYLYISEGYLPDTKISLATLIPDDATIAETEAGKSEWMYKTISAYDKDGKLIAGSMGDATLTAITAENAEATVSTVAVAWKDDAFNVTGSHAISGEASVSIDNAGYASTELKASGDIEGTAKVDATLATVALSIDAPEAITVKPVIAQGASSAKTGEITTTAPTSGKYVAVSADAIAASVAVSPKVATAGYGDADHFSATGVTVTGGSEASGVYYVPVTAGKHEVAMDEADVVNATAVVATATAASAGFEGNLSAGILAAAPAGEYITITADATPTNGSVSGNVSCTVTEGYVETSSETKTVAGDVEVEVTPAAAKYIRVYDGSILD